MASKRVISEETIKKLDGMFQLVREIVEDCEFSKMDIETSFQEQFLEKAQERFEGTGFSIDKEIRTPILNTQKSKCVSKPNPKPNYWRIDFIIHVDNAFIPIELKLRHKGQDIDGYAQDYIDDVDKVRELIINYDDCPECYVVMLTDNKDLKEQCNNKASEYSEANNLVDNRTVTISWTTKSNYYIGIVGRAQTDYRLDNPEGKEFGFLSDEQKSESYKESVLRNLRRK